MRRIGSLVLVGLEAWSIFQLARGIIVNDLVFRVSETIAFNAEALFQFYSLLAIVALVGLAGLNFTWLRWRFRSKAQRLRELYPDLVQLRQDVSDYTAASLPFTVGSVAEQESIKTRLEIMKRRLRDLKLDSPPTRDFITWGWFLSRTAEWSKESAWSMAKEYEVKVGVWPAGNQQQ